MSRSVRATVAPLAALALLALAAGPASARTVANTKDGRPNILVVMTDDQALSDMVAMPNTAALIANRGATFENAVDSFPLCCPSRATFITGQYAHNHGVGGNFFPYGWYGMANRANTLPAWLKSAGYTTALVGKWLNGYGAGTSADKDAQGKALKYGGEIPVGFDNWNGSIDVSAYDYFNFGINQNGKLRYWGNSTYAKSLNDFARIQVIPPEGKSIKTVLDWAAAKIKGSPVDPSTYGTQLTANYSPDVTAGISSSIIKAQASSKKPFFLWWSPASAHREDVNGGIRNAFRNGARYEAKAGSPKQEDPAKLIPDPRPAPRYSRSASSPTVWNSWDWSRITSKPSFDAAPTNKPIKQRLLLADPMTQMRKTQLETNFRGRMGSVKAVDDGLKKLIDTLTSTKQLTNTLILFTSDNGWLQGEHRVPGDKYLPYEESIRIPFLMRGPGIPSGRKISQLVTNVDFTATLLEAAKATAGRTQDGISLLGLAKGTQTPAARAISLEATAPLFADASLPQQWDQPYKGVRTDRWKYVVWGSGDKELYDLQADPYEMTNLADNPSFASVQATLAAKATALQTCIGVSCRVGQ